MAQPGETQTRKAAAEGELHAKLATQKRITLGVIIGALVVILALLVFFIVRDRSTDTPNSDSTPTTATSTTTGTTGSATPAAAGQIAPPNSAGDYMSIVVNPAAINTGVPVLELHSDYQCPICKAFDDYFGASIRQLVAENKVLLAVHIRSFLDHNLQNDASVRAAMASTCADTVGRFYDFHETIMANQPAQEGTGYTDDLLRNLIPANLGITGDDLTSFQSCYDSRATQQYVENMETKNTNAGVTATPTYLINGKTVDLRGAITDDNQVMTAEVLLAFIQSQA